MEKFEKDGVKYTMIPYSELALHLGIAGKMGRVVWMGETWVVIELNGKKYEGLTSELVDISDGWEQRTIRENINPLRRKYASRGKNKECGR